MIQSTESISAINSMSATVGLIRAKNAFLRKLSKDIISQEDIQREGEKEWRIIEESYKPILKWNDVDFTDLKEKREYKKIICNHSWTISPSTSPTSSSTLYGLNHQQDGK